MKKITLSLILSLGLFLFATAQNEQSRYKIGLRGEYLIPQGNTAYYNASGYGVSVQGEYRLLPQLNATLSAGIISLPYAKLYKEMLEPWLDEPLKNRSFYPAKGGVKYYFGKYFYGTAEAGAVILSEESMSTFFAYAGGVGGILPLNAKSNLDLGVRYETWAQNSNATSSFIGISVAYAFGF